MSYFTRKYNTIKYNLTNLTWARFKFKLYLLWIGGIYHGYYLEPNEYYYPIRNRLYKFFEYLGCSASVNPLRSKSYSPNIFYAAHGWEKLVFDLTKELVKSGWNKQLYQVKSKYGILRYYTGGLTDDQYAIISKYEDLSYKTCEDCGSTDNVTQTNGWVYTLCTKCLNKNKNV